MSLLDTDLPLVAAPMAGGPTTPDLVRAVARAGGFAFLAGGYLAPDDLDARIRTVREDTTAYGVNLFVPGPDAVDPREYAAYRAELAPEAAALRVDLPAHPVTDDDHWRDKLELLIADPVPVVSFTFGLPAASGVRALRAAGSRVLATVTAPAEARAADELGVDGLIVQGPRAGGHSGTFDPRRPIGSGPTLDALASVRAETALPIIATGGVDGPGAVAELLAGGAEAVAVGTLLLTADEAGTSAVHRAALTDPRFTETVLTRAFTGRPARALRNAFVDRHESAAIDGYPAVHHLTRPFRVHAARTGDAERLHLWAGTGHRAAVAAPAADIVAGLVGPAT